MPKKIETLIETSDPSFFSKVSQIHRYTKEIKEKENIVSSLSEQVKELSKKEWCQLYRQTGENPGLVKVFSQYEDEISSVLFVPSDRYISLNEKTKSSIIQELGQDVIQQISEWTISPEMVEKYLPILKEMIENSQDILPEDKGKIIQENSKSSIKPGTIDKLNELGDVEMVFEKVKPVVSLKNIEVQKNSLRFLDI